MRVVDIWLVSVDNIDGVGVGGSDGLSSSSLGIVGFVRRVVESGEGSVDMSGDCIANVKAKVMLCPSCRVGFHVRFAIPRVWVG